LRREPRAASSLSPLVHHSEAHRMASQPTLRSDALLDRRPPRRRNEHRAHHPAVAAVRAAPADAARGAHDPGGGRRGARPSGHPGGARRNRGRPLGSLRALSRAAGVRVLNPPAALISAHDKLVTARALRRAGLPHPETRPLTAWEKPPD